MQEDVTLLGFAPLEFERRVVLLANPVYFLRQRVSQYSDLLTTSSRFHPLGWMRCRAYPGHAANLVIQLLPVRVPGMGRVL